MTLVNRVSAFFLTALAIALGLSSTFIYVLMRESYEEELNAEIAAALNSLVAAVEAEPGEVKWQPSEHRIALSQNGEPNAAVRWLVTDERGAVVDQSPLFRDPGKQERRLVASLRDMDLAKSYFRTGRASHGRFDGWRYKRAHIVAPPQSDQDNADDDDAPEPDEFNELYLTAAISERWLNDRLATLAWSVTIFPLATWLVAAIAGRWFVRRALAPVGAMATKAKGMTGDAVDQRLPAPPHDDELAVLASALNGLLDRRQRAFEEQRRFTGDAAHQLRTPLTVLGGHIDVALRREREAGEYRQTLSVLQEEVGEMRKIVDSLLFLARAEGDAALPDRATMDLGIWLPRYMERWGDHARRQDMHLELAKPATVNASSPLLAQLLDNLVSNACKYSAPGTLVRIVADTNARGATISVVDRGAGIAADDQAAVFEPFVRTADARQRGVAGTGLGLAIAARIARALGGKIELASVLGEGSAFTVMLPQVAPGQ